MKTRRILSLTALISAALILILSASGCGEKKVKPDEIRHDYVLNSESASRTLVVTAVDSKGRTLWEYSSPDCMLTELDTVEYIGEFGDIVVVNEQEFTDETVSVSDEDGYPERTGRLRALDIYTGEVVWDNYDFIGASTAHAYDAESGILYLCGYYGPDCCAVDSSGKILWMGTNSGGYMWPYYLELGEDRITVFFDGSGDGDSEGAPYKAAFAYNGNPII